MISALEARVLELGMPDAPDSILTEEETEAAYRLWERDLLSLEIVNAVDTFTTTPDGEDAFFEHVLVSAYRVTKSALEKAGPSRQRWLALATLEQSFYHGMLAIKGRLDPIRQYGT